MTDLMFTTRGGANFERPDTGMYHGILADIVDLGTVTTVYNGQAKTQPMVRFVWFLNAAGKDGKQLSVTARFNNNLHEKSKLYASVKQILNAPPPVTLNPETLLGSVRKLFIQREITGEGQQKKDFANILGISPADPGIAVPIPADFVRDKNKPADQQARFKKKNPAFNPQQPGQPQLPQLPQQAIAPSVFGQGAPPTGFRALTQGADIAF
jgi:hypothetical protein